MRKKYQKTVWTRSNVPNKGFTKTKTATNNEESSKRLAWPSCSREECPNLSKANLLFGLGVCPKTRIQIKPRAPSLVSDAVIENNKRKDEMDSESSNNQLSTSIENGALTENSSSSTIITDQLRFEKTVSNYSLLPGSQQPANPGQIQDVDKRDENSQRKDAEEEQDNDLFLYESDSDDELVVTIGDMQTTIASHRNVTEEPQQRTYPTDSQPLPIACNATMTYDPVFASISKSVSNPTLMTPLANIFVPYYIPVANLYAQSPIVEWKGHSVFQPQVPNKSKPLSLFPLLNNHPLAITYESTELSLPATINHKSNIQQYEGQARTYVENREAGNFGRRGFHKRPRNFNTHVSKENYPDKPLQRYPPRPQAKNLSKNLAQNRPFFMEEKQSDARYHNGRDRPTVNRYGFTAHPTVNPSHAREEEKQSDVRYHNGRGRPTVNRHGFTAHPTVNPSHAREGNKHANNDKPPHWCPPQSQMFPNNHRYRPLSQKNTIYNNQQDRAKGYNREWDSHKGVSLNNEQRDRSKFGIGQDTQIPE